MRHVPLPLLLLLASPCAATLTVTCTDPTDCTTDVQKAFDDATVDSVVIPASGTPWPVTPLFIRRSNLLVTLEKGATLEAKAGSFVGTNDCLLTVRDGSNVTIRATGATLRSAGAAF